MIAAWCLMQKWGDARASPRKSEAPRRGASVNEGLRRPRGGYVPVGLYHWTVMLQVAPFPHWVLFLVGLHSWTLM